MFEVPYLASSEVAHDPFLPLAIAAQATSKISLATTIAVAFSRTPMTMATVTWDLHALSGGRFTLGLGSQIKPHIEKRYGMPWSRPAARMKEYILALRAIWSAWQTDGPLNFEGEFYCHTLMTPMFCPGRIDSGAPRINLAAVGPMMTGVAGEVADGLLVHGFTTRRYEERRVLPVLHAALERSGRLRSDFEVVLSPFIVCGSTEEEMASAAMTIKGQIAFYASTPAYRPVLEEHGWGELQPELLAMTKRGEWSTMGELIDDEMLRAFVVISEPQHLPIALAERVGGIGDCINLPYSTLPEEELAKAVAFLKGVSFGRT